jgi:DNA polymerase
MPIEPLIVDLVGGRTLHLTPAEKGFPDFVRIEYQDGLGQERLFAAFNMGGGAATRQLEREINLSAGEFLQLTRLYKGWLAEIKEKEKAEAGKPEEKTWKPTPPYQLTQRTIQQPKKEALVYGEISSAVGILAILHKQIEAPDTLLEWDAETLKYLACLDVDFHDHEAPERLDNEGLDELGRELAPAPLCWWRTQGGGLKAIYTATPNDLYTAQELAAAAAAQLLTLIPVLRARGTVEVINKTRHPGSPQKGQRCGRVMDSIPTDHLKVLERFSKAEATEEEVAEIMDLMGLKGGERLDHSYCLIDPEHKSTSPTPIYVDKHGLYCHSCHGRIGRGNMTWGYIRRSRGMALENQYALAPIRYAFENIVHVEHVDYLFTELFPNLPESLRHPLYSAQLKATHKEALKVKKDSIQRIEAAFHPFFFVRGDGHWLHKDTLLEAQRLTGADVSILPSCQRYDKEEDVSKPRQAYITAHTNNGRLPGWIPIQAYSFEPIFLVHNRDASSGSVIRCKPKVRTTQARVSYVALKNRMPLAEAEAAITAYFPGANLQYIRALIIAMGCAESGEGPPPMLWATGPTEAAKTTTIRIVTEMYGELFQDLSGIQEERLNQSVGDAMRLSRLLVFDDFAKNPADYRHLHAFTTRLNRAAFTHYKNYKGAESPPFNNAVIFTDWRIPAFFSQDQQFGRRVHLLRLDSRLTTSWEKMGHMVEKWWMATPELTKAAHALHSWVIDEYFPPGSKTSFAVKMAMLDIPLLEAEAGGTDTHDAVKDLVVELIERIAASPEEDGTTQKRVGRGSRFIDWNKAGTVGATCQLLVESLGKGSSGQRDEDRLHAAENLKHVLDPFQLHLPKMYAFRDGVKAVEFDIRSWGARSYVRLVEAGRARSRARSVNAELFATWPPVRRAAPAEAPTVAPAAAAALQPLPELGDEEPFVLDPTEFTDPVIAYLDFETQSACNLRWHGGYVYAEHPSTKVMCAAIIVDGRRIYWTELEYKLTMPTGVEYEHGLDFLRDMVTDPAGCVIVAHNVGFERAIWTRTLKLPEPLAWRDTMDRTLSKGLAAGADEAGLTLFGMGKDEEGKRFISRIWGPNPDTGDLPPLTDYVIQNILNYNFRDTDISYGIAQKFGLNATPEWEQDVCDLHHKINYWGICIDKQFATTLRDFDEEFKVVAGAYVEQLTDGSVTRADLTRGDFLREQLNLNLPSQLQLPDMKLETLQKLVNLYEEQEESKSAADQTGIIAHEVVEVIRCRLAVSRAALAKVDKALKCVSADGRAKGQLRYHGASTGRWSGYQIQIQNMKRPNEEFDLAAAAQAVENQDREKFNELCKGQPPYELLGSLIRGIIVPAPGNVFVVGDFASVEARGVLWLADDEEGLVDYRRKDAADEVHPDGKDPNVPDTYQILAGTIFGKNPLTVTKRERGGGKIGILSAGFGGGPNAVIRMAGPLGVDLKGLGIDPQAIINGYRMKYDKVVKKWHECQNQFTALLQSNRTTVLPAGKLSFERKPDCVEMRLPSGRVITYWNARMERDPFDDRRQVIVYDNAVNGKVLQRRTYSGKIYENAVQGFCRDLLADVMLRADRAGASIAFHVHDEIVLEVPEQHGPAWRDWLEREMRTAPAWAQGMPVFSKPEIMSRRYGK